MRRKQDRILVNMTPDDADVAAGMVTLPSPPVSRGGMSVNTTSDLEFFEDLVSEPVLVLGVDISHLSRQGQFMLCAAGVFGFSLLYGYLQELLSVQLCNRQLGLFLATVQFTGYTALSFVMRTYVYESQKRKKLTPKAPGTLTDSNVPSSSSDKEFHQVPFRLYLGLSLLRAIDLGMTNLAMQYINYPAKTLMKSSRVVFTMIFGVLIAKKTYRWIDYFIVVCMVLGLAIFMHADANSSAVFQPLGVFMLTVSLICDGAITNMSESIMNQFGVGQDEFIFRMYSIALVAISGAAFAKGDLRDGLIWMMQPGTYAEQQSNVPLDERTWSSLGKIAVMVLFSTMGFFGSSCSAAITKNFGALVMSITSTARKATTLFLSFLLFDNECTWEHVVGIVVFISALTAKSLKRSRNRSSKDWRKRRDFRRMASSDLELGGGGAQSLRRVPASTSSFDSADSSSRRGVHRRNASADPSPSSTPSRRGRSDNESSKHAQRVRYHVV